MSFSLVGISSLFANSNKAFFSPGPGGAELYASSPSDFNGKGFADGTGGANFSCCIISLTSLFSADVAFPCTKLFKSSFIDLKDCIDFIKKIDMMMWILELSYLVLEYRH